MVYRRAAIIGAFVVVAAVSPVGAGAVTPLRAGAVSAPPTASQPAVTSSGVEVAGTSVSAPGTTIAASDRASNDTKLRSLGIGVAGLAAVGAAGLAFQRRHRAARQLG